MRDQKMKVVIVGGVAGGASAAARARRLSEDAHIVLVNGHFVCGEARHQHNLCEGDVVSVWPPVAGG